jgi:hypothetical protein
LIKVKSVMMLLRASIWANVHRRVRPFNHVVVRNRSAWFAN